MRQFFIMGSGTLTVTVQALLCQLYGRLMDTIARPVTYHQHYPVQDDATCGSQSISPAPVCATGGRKQPFVPLQLRPGRKPAPKHGVVELPEQSRCILPPSLLLEPRQRRLRHSWPLPGRLAPSWGGRYRSAGTGRDERRDLVLGVGRVCGRCLWFGWPAPARSGWARCGVDHADGLLCAGGFIPATSCEQDVGSMVARARSQDENGPVVLIRRAF